MATEILNNIAILSHKRREQVSQLFERFSVRRTEKFPS